MWWGGERRSSRGERGRRKEGIGERVGKRENCTKQWHVERGKEQERRNLGEETDQRATDPLLLQKLSPKDRQKYEELQQAKKRKAPAKKDAALQPGSDAAAGAPGAKGKKKSATVVRSQHSSR